MMMSGWMVAIPETLRAGANREFTARHGWQPRALALVPLRHAGAHNWTLTDKAGGEVAPGARQWLETVEIRQPGESAGHPDRVGGQWRWSTTVDQFLPQPPSPGAALVLWLVQSRAGGELLHRVEPAASRVIGDTAATTAVPPRIDPDDRRALLEAIHAAVGRHTFDALTGSARLDWR